MTVVIDPANVPPKRRGIYGSEGGISCHRSNGDTGHWMCFERSSRTIHRSRQHCRIRVMKKSVGPALRNISTNDTLCSSINQQLIGTCDGNNMAPVILNEGVPRRTNGCLGRNRWAYKWQGENRLILHSLTAAVCETSRPGTLREPKLTGKYLYFMSQFSPF